MAADPAATWSEEDSASRVDVSTTRGRNFNGTVGLAPGYDGAEPLSRDRVLAECRAWMTRRAAQQQPYLAVIVGPQEEILYAFEEQGVLAVRQEPVLAVRGEVDRYHEHLTDDQVVETLKSLFASLGAALGQCTVRFLYHGDGGLRCAYRLRLPDTRHPLDSR
eukprot:TRINITY_DN7213_c0_g1_i1.p1 TRINITY_DN7213_c0_g1~~TRINITY_DN7213_c0_g1_i1.p1  ORF type:complete len:163 (+),score=37.49 TRINITY_DN7213_c0_g1_i1:73-561(+)